MLKLRRIAIDTYKENVAYLARSCPLYRAAEFQPLSKIEVSCGGRKILATLNIVDDASILGLEELGLSIQSFALLDRPEQAPVTIAHSTPIASAEWIREKLQGAVLPEHAYDEIIRDVAAHRYSKMEIAAFLIASASFMTTEEVLHLTRAMVAAGTRLHWESSSVVDKHCIGGIPGNRTSMILVPIVVAHGLTIPKTSSRAITSPAGTADTMEVLARVDIAEDEMRDIVRRVRGCLVWGGRVNLSPADDVLISVERTLQIDTREQMVASILSKKIAAGATHLLIDMPIGPSAKIRSMGEAIRLRKLFEHIGDAMAIALDVVISEVIQPIGRGVGPMLEARDVMRVLECAPDAPTDLRDASLALAGRVLEFDPALRGGTGVQRARELLESRQALRAMEQIIAAQGAPPTSPTLGHLTHDVVSPMDGVVANIDCHRIARIARLAGAPSDQGAGVDLFKKAGELVIRGEPLYRIHAAFQVDFGFATDLAKVDSGCKVLSV